MRRLLIAAAVLLLLVGLAAVAGWWYVRGDDGTTVASEDAAELVDAADADDAHVDPVLRPAPGTYTYEGSGGDSLDLFGGSSHEFPERIGVVVELDPDDSCRWTMHVVFIEEHVEERHACTDAQGVRELGLARTTAFLGRRQTSTYACDESAMRLPVPARAGAVQRWTCTEQRGGVVRYEARIVGQETIEVAGEPFATWHVRITGTQDDASSGEEQTELWLASTGLPVRMQSKRSLTVTAPRPVERMTSSEEWRYELARPGPTQPAE